MADKKETEDPENPTILTNVDRSKMNLWQGIPRTPIDGLVLTSSIINPILTLMYAYALTGRGNLSGILALFAVPFSVITTINGSKSDYDNWVKTQRHRERGIPDKFMPYKVKYDWTEFHERRQQTASIKPKFTGAGGAIEEQ